LPHFPLIFFEIPHPFEVPSYFLRAYLFTFITPNRSRLFAPYRQLVLLLRTAVVLSATT